MAALVVCVSFSFHLNTLSLSLSLCVYRMFGFAHRGEVGFLCVPALFSRYPPRLLQPAVLHRSESPPAPPPPSFSSSSHSAGSDQIGQQYRCLFLFCSGSLHPMFSSGSAGWSAAPSPVCSLSSALHRGDAGHVVCVHHGWRPLSHTPVSLRTKREVTVGTDTHTHTLELLLKWGV